MNIGVYYIA